MYVCPSIFSTTVHPIDFTLVWCFAEDTMKCSVECEVVWMSGSREIYKKYLINNVANVDLPHLPVGSTSGNTDSTTIATHIVVRGDYVPG